MYGLRRKAGTRKGNGAKSCVQGDKQIKDNSDIKWNRGSGDLRARPRPAKPPNCEKKLKNTLGPCVVAPIFNPGTEKTEAGRSLRLSLN